MEVRFSNRWGESPADVNSHMMSLAKRTLVIALAATVLFAAGVAVTYLALNPALAKVDSPGTTIVDQSDELNRIQRDMAELTNRVFRMEQDNAALREEGYVLTSENGVLAGIIKQLRLVRGEAEFMRRGVLATGSEPPSVRDNPGDGDDYRSDVAMAAPRARHLVVTPSVKPSEPPASEQAEGEKAE